MLQPRIISLISRRCGSATAKVNAEDASKASYMKKLASNVNEDEYPPGWNEAKPYEDIPGPKPWPIVGNVRLYLPGGSLYKKNFFEQSQIMRQTYGPIVRVERLLPGVEMVSTFDPQDFETIFRNEGVWPIRQGMNTIDHYRLEVREDFFKGQGGLLSTGGESWSHVRRVVNPPLMQPKSAKMYTEKIDDVSHDFIKLISLLAKKNAKNEMPADFLNIIFKWSLESISVIALDTRLGCLDPDLKPDSDGQKMINLTQKAFKLVYELDFTPSIWKTIRTPKYYEFLKTEDGILEFAEKYINFALEKIKNSDGKLKDDSEASILERILKKDELIAKVMATDMLGAGIETTGKTMGAALYFLARNPAVQDKLREEVKLFLPEKDSPFKADFLEGMPYLSAVLKETMRISPISSGNSRKTPKNIVLSGYRIPKGIHLITNNLMLCHMDEYFPKAKEFLPERWLRNDCPEELKTDLNPFIYLPFGFGPRSCVGKRLAKLELEVGLAKIIRNFKIEWHHGDLPFTQSLIYGIDGELKLTMKPIN